LYVPEDQEINIPEHLFRFKKLEEVNVNHNAEG